MNPVNKRKIVTSILLSVFTFGAYAVFWRYLLVKNTRILKGNDASCTGEMLCLIFVPFYGLYWWYTRGRAVKEAFGRQGYQASLNGSIYLLLSFFGLDIVAMAIMQHDFNELPAEPLPVNKRAMTAVATALSIASLVSAAFLAAVPGLLPLRYLFSVIIQSPLPKSEMEAWGLGMIYLWCALFALAISVITTVFIKINFPKNAPSRSLKASRIISKTARYLVLADTLIVIISVFVSKSNFSFYTIIEQFPVVFRALNVGFLQTLKLFGVTLIGAIPLGLVIAFGSMSQNKAVSKIVRFFVWIIRGTPLMLQLLIIFYFPGLVFGKPIWGNGESARFLASSIAFIINYSCYFSEIYRGGIQGVPVGQQEAGQVLGLSTVQIFFRITLLQMIKRIVPPMSNEIITLVKDTSLARIIALQEVIWAGQAFMKGSNGISGAIWPLFFTGVYYLVFSGILTLLFGRIEKKLSYFKA